MDIDERIVRLRRAERSDSSAIDALIRRSARRLGAGDYTREQIEAALTGAWGLDAQLIEDGTMIVAEAAGRLVGCGAWSARRALFGTADLPDRDTGLLDPATEPAKIRAFFVDPDFARREIGQRLLERCEREAWQHGFKSVELGATIPGKRFYASQGYLVDRSYDFECAPGVVLEVTVMSKRIEPV